MRNSEQSSYDTNVSNFLGKIEITKFLIEQLPLLGEGERQGGRSEDVKMGKGIVQTVTKYVPSFQHCYLHS